VPTTDVTVLSAFPEMGLGRKEVKVKECTFDAAEIEECFARGSVWQVRTYETEHDSEGSGTAESEKDIDHDSSSSSSD
jgi:hypothetical protein